jgi:hypothetical protein
MHHITACSNDNRCFVHPLHTFASFAYILQHTMAKKGEKDFLSMIFENIKSK